MRRFEINYLQFFDDISSTIPELFDDTDKSKNDIKCQEVDLPRGKELLYFFVDNWYPHMEPASKADIEYFEKLEKCPPIFPEKSFLEVMEKLSNTNKNIVWEYIHTLFALSASLDEVKEKYENDEEVQKTKSMFSDIVRNMVEWKRGKNKVELDEKFMENSSIKKLADQISKEINPEEIMGIETKMENPMDMFKAILSGDESSGIGKLMKSVTEKLKEKMESGEINQDDLFKDANALLQNLNGGEGMPNLSNFMSMAQNLSQMGDMFNMKGMGKQAGGKRFNKKLKKKIKKEKERRDKAD